MNVPIDNPIIQFLFWLLHTPGLGGIAVAVVAFGSIMIYTITLFWIRAGGEVGDADSYAYPTPTLIHPHDHELE